MTRQEGRGFLFDLRQEVNQSADDLAGAYNYLRARRARVATALERLLNTEQMEEIREAVESKVDDPQARQELTDLLSKLTQQHEELAAQLREKEDDDVALEIRKIEIQERRWKMRKSILDREPAAVLVGAVLLAVLTVALIFAMFFHTPVPEILSSAFLLILGFFFGQTASGKGKSG
ncbi:hypothetical protein KO481_16865 [Nocardia sp. NEAU-G5]|uniref:Uncharacterized protein n=1 Tax=Nocardia albiluteola TaxID=2842303 RepID=A0ABS6B1T4_9NOCA|nr:hypothetical protein [Nocardia albiluteola]MBU3063194.1 hypothetical protein [Nocardia albiluteola]